MTATAPRTSIAPLLESFQKVSQAGHFRKETTCRHCMVWLHLATFTLFLQLFQRTQCPIERAGPPLSVDFAKLDIGGRDCCRQGDVFQVNVLATFRKDESLQALGPLTLEGSHPFAPHLHQRRLSREVADYHQLKVTLRLKMSGVLLEMVFEGRPFKDSRGAVTCCRRRFSFRGNGRRRLPRRGGGTQAGRPEGPVRFVWSRCDCDVLLS